MSLSGDQGRSSIEANERVIQHQWIGLKPAAVLKIKFVGISFNRHDILGCSARCILVMLIKSCKQWQRRPDCSCMRQKIQPSDNQPVVLVMLTMSCK